MNYQNQSQQFKKGSFYTRSDIYNLYFGEPLPLKGTGNWTSGYVQPANSKDLIIFMNIDVAGKSGHNYPNKYNLLVMKTTRTFWLNCFDTQHSFLLV